MESASVGVILRWLSSLQIPVLKHLLFLSLISSRPVLPTSWEPLRPGIVEDKLSSRD